MGVWLPATKRVSLPLAHQAGETLEARLLCQVAAVCRATIRRPHQQAAAETPPPSVFLCTHATTLRRARPARAHKCPMARSRVGSRTAGPVRRAARSPAYALGADGSAAQH